MYPRPISCIRSIVDDSVHSRGFRLPDVARQVSYFTHYGIYISDRCDTLL